MVRLLSVKLYWRCHACKRENEADNQRKSDWRVNKSGVGMGRVERESTTHSGECLFLKGRPSSAGCAPARTTFETTSLQMSRVAPTGYSILRPSPLESPRCLPAPRRQSRPSTRAQGCYRDRRWATESCRTTDALHGRHRRAVEASLRAAPPCHRAMDTGSPPAWLYCL